MNIYEKLAAICRDVQYLNKDSKVDFGKTNYKALSEEKVTSLLRQKMNDHKLIVFPITQESSRSGNITHVDVRYRIVNTEAPDEFIEVASCGDGADTQDKGSGKAMTYAFKYMWLRTFMIPTGEDPDKISSEELTERFAMEAAEAKIAAQSKWTCVECGRPITAYGRRSAEEIYEGAIGLFHKPLCAECVKAETAKANAKEKAKAGAAK